MSQAILNDTLSLTNINKSIFPLCREDNAKLKRLEDIILGFIITTIILLPMIFIAIGVKLSSKGPVLFTQKRRGLDGKEFNIYKFRTMGIEESSKALSGEKVTQVTKGDPRVTKFGALLRKTSLDELPQFFNVLSGEMSIVGPRPHAIIHDEMYSKMIAAYPLRHLVKPGITGWAQVNGLRGETDTLEKMEKRVEHDITYISKGNLLLDLKIILLTFSKKAHKNAY
jgi:putative colanic acid biosynthesis UDP-glucose lipid carrier transferase